MVGIVNSPFSLTPLCILFPPPPPPPKKKKNYINIVSNFSWVLQSSQEKYKAMVIQNFEG